MRRRRREGDGCVLRQRRRQREKRLSYVVAKAVEGERQSLVMQCIGGGRGDTWTIFQPDLAGSNMNMRGDSGATPWDRLGTEEASRPPIIRWRPFYIWKSAVDGRGKGDSWVMRRRRREGDGCVLQQRRRQGEKRLSYVVAKAVKGERQSLVMQCRGGSRGDTWTIFQLDLAGSNMNMRFGEIAPSNTYFYFF
ncbi:hypothetical protein Q3G72_011853 [Acer saccharum]|nr:hypothetical protein Q3G72_011853 [Acer saccharum]